VKKTFYTVFLVFIVVGAVAITVGQAPVQAELGDTVSTPLADPMYMKFDGVDGESTDNAHRDWIDLQSFQYGISKPSSGAGGMSRSRSYVTTYDVTITKQFDKSSPKLMEALTAGSMFNTVQLEFTRIYPDGGDAVYLRYEFRDVQITSYRVSMSSEDSAPLEEISFNYGKITVTYTEIDETGEPKGNVEWSYTVARGDR